MSPHSIAFGSAIFIAGSTLAMLAACPVTRTELDPTHCNSNGGDVWCGQQHPDGSRPYCRLGVKMCDEAAGITDFDVDGCVAQRPEDACYSACGEGRAIVDDPECEGVASASSGSGSGSGSGSDAGSGSTTAADTDASSSGTTGPMPCDDDEQCTDGDALFCGAAGECVSCEELTDGDAACAENDATTPLCVGSACVACTADETTVCDSDLLICDDETNACVACTEHGQCDSGACNIAEGTCFDPTNVLDVGDGQMYGTIAAALDEVEMTPLDNAVLRLHEGTDFNEVAQVETGAVAFIAADGENPQWINSAVAAPTLTVSGEDTRVYVVGVRLSQNGNDVGLMVDGATVDIRRSRIVQNSGGGIVAQGGAQLMVRNSFVGTTANVPAMEVTGATVELLSTTIGNDSFGPNAAAFACDGTATVTIRNSILVSQSAQPELDCSGATIDYSAAEADLGGTNTAVNSVDPGWFVNFTSGDLHLSGSGATTFADLAQWQDGDPTTDIDGDLRPSTDGAMDYPGADVP